MALFRFGRSQDDSEKEIPRTESTSPESDQASRPGFLARLRSGLERTRQVLVTDVRDLFKREGRLVDDGFLEELRACWCKAILALLPLTQSLRTSQFAIAQSRGS